MIAIAVAAIAFMMPATVPAPRIVRAAPTVPIMCSSETPINNSDTPVVDKQLSNEKLIKFTSISEEFKPLVNVALERLDRNRVMQGKPKYETINGMIDAYVEESAKAGLNWTREEAESEVTRYMMRQALADEGGIGGGGKGDGQDKAAFGLLALTIFSVAYQTAGGQLPALPEGGFQQPFF